MIITLRSQLIRIGQLVQSHSIPVKQCPSTLVLLLLLLPLHHPSLSPFPRTALSVGNISLHHCRLSVRDSDYGSHLHRGERCAASHSAGARRAHINVCCRRAGAFINHRLKLAKKLHLIYLRLINTLLPILQG